MIYILRMPSYPSRTLYPQKYRKTTMLHWHHYMRTTSDVSIQPVHADRLALQHPGAFCHKYIHFLIPHMQLTSQLLAGYHGPKISLCCLHILVRYPSERFVPLRRCAGIYAADVKVSVSAMAPVIPLSTL
jgi:hypothetical protein